jgi:hypothetical protein
MLFQILLSDGRKIWKAGSDTDEIWNIVEYWFDEELCDRVTTILSIEPV